MKEEIPQVALPNAVLSFVEILMTWYKPSQSPDGCLLFTTFQLKEKFSQLCPGIPIELIYPAMTQKGFSITVVKNSCVDFDFYWMLREV